MDPRWIEIKWRSYKLVGFAKYKVGKDLNNPISCILNFLIWQHERLKGSLSEIIKIKILTHLIFCKTNKLVWSSLNLNRSGVHSSLIQVLYPCSPALPSLSAPLPAHFQTQLVNNQQDLPLPSYKLLYESRENKSMTINQQQQWCQQTLQAKLHSLGYPDPMQSLNLRDWGKKIQGECAGAKENGDEVVARL